MKNAKRLVQPGNTSIAYIDDNNCCVGVVIKQDEGDERRWKILVLGLFQDYERKNGIFNKPFPYTFPGYESVMKNDVLVYDFKPEITLCKMRDSTWWKSLGAPCYTNLVAKHFRPRQLQSLQYIDMAIQILKGKSIDECKTIGYWDELIFLKLWAVLYCHFPVKVVKPPQEHNSRNSNIYYKIDMKSNPPTVLTGLRPPDYKKPA